MNDVSEATSTLLRSRAGQPFFRDRNRFLVFRVLAMLVRKVKRHRQEPVAGAFSEAGVPCQGRTGPVRMSAIATPMR